MNILPFVITLLLVFSIFSSTLLKRHRGFHVEKTTYASFMEAERNARNKLEAAYYKSIEAKKKPKPPSTEKDPKKGPPPKKAISRDLHPHSKLAVGTMFQNKALMEVAQRLFKKLYGAAPFYSPGLEKRLFHALRTDEHSFSWLDLMPKDKELAAIYLKVLRGTTYYDVETKEGYPPLEAYFTLEKQNAPILFGSTPRLLIETLVGKAKLSAIIEQEYENKGRPDSLTQSQFIALCKDVDPEVLALISFTGSFPKEEGVVSVVNGMRILKKLNNTARVE